MLIEGLDAIDLTLKQRGAIDAFTPATATSGRGSTFWTEAAGIDE